jgi:hypothetical protein
LFSYIGQDFGPIATLYHACFSPNSLSSETGTVGDGENVDRPVLEFNPDLTLAHDRQRQLQSGESRCDGN